MPGEGAGIPFGQYVLLRRLARGGMAEVFLAQQKGLEGFDRRVAVKRILPHLADVPDFIKMFLGEAKLAAQLTHPNIVHIYDFGKVESDYFIAMEYVNGVHAGDLFSHGANGDRLTPTMVARLGADAAAALHYAHEVRTPTGQRVGLVHRDVSPANLMVSFDGVVKLCDFGIAKAAAISDKLTHPGTVKGKYAYMSPEQTTGIPLDGRSDVYSLAIVLWELLSGKTIVPRGDAVEAMRAIRDGKLTPIEQAAPWTPAPLARAITWALQTKREQRPTAMQLAQELEAFIKSSPDLATPMQLGAWLRDRFPREATGETDTVPEGTEAVHHTLAAPQSAQSMAIPRGIDPRIAATLPPINTTGETVALPPLNRAVEALAQGRPAPISPPADVPAAGAASAADAADAATVIGPPMVGIAPLEPPPSKPLAAHAVTVFGEAPARHPLIAHAAQAATVIGLPGPGLPSPPGALPPTVIYDPSQVHGSPMFGAPAVPAAPTMWMQPVRNRRALAYGGLVALALVSFLIALAARGPARLTIRDAGVVAVVAPDAAVAPPIDAAPIELDAAPIELDAAPIELDAAPIELDAAPIEVLDAAAPPVPADGDAVATLEIRTRPEGATLKIAGESHAAPAEISLAPGRYYIDAELDGWMPERRAVELIGGERVVQEIVFTLPLHGAQAGRLLARTTPPSEVFLGTRRLSETPLDLELDPGTYTLVFKHPRHANLIKRVTITAGKTTKLQLALP